MHMNLVLIVFALYSIHAYAKTLKTDDNIIAVFSEDEISLNLPKPDIIAAQIPKKLILKDDKIAKFSINESKDKLNRDTMIDRKAAGNKRDKLSKSKQAQKKPDDNIINKRGAVENHDFKSKNTKGDENEFDDNFIVVETNQFASITATTTNIPTATMLSSTEANLDKNVFKIALVNASSDSGNFKSPISVSAQKVKKFKPRTQMNSKIAVASSTLENSYNSSILLIIVLSAILVANV